MDVSFRLSIPVPVAPVHLYDGLVFLFWFPSESNAIDFEQDDVNGRIWFDLSCTNQAPDREGKFHDGVSAHAMKMDLVLKDVSEELWPHLARTARKAPSGELREQRISISRRLHRAGVHFANRVISCFRVYLGQFWILEYPDEAGLMEMTLRTFSPQVMVDGNWQKLGGTGTADKIDLRGSGEPQALQEEQFGELADYVRGDHRPDLALDLLSRADLLAKQRHRRSSLLEACTALEISVAEFMEHVDERPDLRARLNGVFGDDHRLAKKAERLGTTQTIRLMLPLLLSEEQVSRKTLAATASAMTKRNAVVHTRLRDVSSIDLTGHLRSIRALCTALAGLVKETNE